MTQSGNAGIIWIKDNSGNNLMKFSMKKSGMDFGETNEKVASRVLTGNFSIPILYWYYEKTNTFKIDMTVYILLCSCVIGTFHFRVISKKKNSSCENPGSKICAKNWKRKRTTRFWANECRPSLIACRTTHRKLFEPSLRNNGIRLTF